MPPDLTFLPTLIGSNYPCLELIFMEPACSSHWSSTAITSKNQRKNDDIGESYTSRHVDERVISYWVSASLLALENIQYALTLTYTKEAT